MTARVLLEYPNGRVHETTIEATLKPGTEFELFGRRWRAVGPPVDRYGRSNRADSDAIVCRTLSSSRL